MLKYGKLALLNNPKAIFFKSGQTIKWQFDMYHGVGNLDKAIDLLPEKDKSLVTYSTSQINYEPKPGRIMFFPSHLPHLFSVDNGYEPFRFIHFNCQAIPKSVLK